MDTVMIRRLHRESDPVGALAALRDQLSDGQMIDVRTPIIPGRLLRPGQHCFSAMSLEITLRRAGYEDITVRRRPLSRRATARP